MAAVSTSTPITPASGNPGQQLIIPGSPTAPPANSLPIGPFPRPGSLALRNSPGAVVRVEVRQADPIQSSNADIECVVQTPSTLRAPIVTVHSAPSDVMASESVPKPDPALQLSRLPLAQPLHEPVYQRRQYRHEGQQQDQQQGQQESHQEDQQQHQQEHRQQQQQQQQQQQEQQRQLQQHNQYQQPQLQHHQLGRVPPGSIHDLPPLRPVVYHDFRSPPTFPSPVRPDHEQLNGSFESSRLSSVPLAADFSIPNFDFKLSMPASSGPNGNAVVSSRPGQADLADKKDGKVEGEAKDATVHETNRRSAEADSSSSSSLMAPHEASSTSVSSGSGRQGTPEGHDRSADDGSQGTSILEDGGSDKPAVQPFQYHHVHESQPERDEIARAANNPRAASSPNLLDSAVIINRRLTPSQGHVRIRSMARPKSAYSFKQDVNLARGQSPGLGVPGGNGGRSPSMASRRSPENRNSTYAELLSVPYPQAAPAPLGFDNSMLRNVVGNNAELLSAQKTLEMYRQNVRKTADYSIQYSFAVFLIATAQDQINNMESSNGGGSGMESRNVNQNNQHPDLGDQGGGPGAKRHIRKRQPVPVQQQAGQQQQVVAGGSPEELIKEARNILQRLANNGYPFAQYYLADGYASGLFSKGKEDYGSAFPLFVLAAKHGHAESAYRAGLCYEFGAGSRKDPAKALQFLRSAASKNHPGAMTRLGQTFLSGDLGEKRYREGIKWLKLATEAADAMYNIAPYHLGCLFETGYGDDVFQDESYAAELFTQAAELGHREANYRLGDSYERGKLGCPRDPALSVHFYTGAAERGHAAAMMGLCAWYMVGAEPILEKDAEEAYEWARAAAELGLVKAQYAVGYFTEMGIGCRRDGLEANMWYVRAADAGDERAKQRLAVIRATMGGTDDLTAGAKGKTGQKSSSDGCVVM